MVQKETKRVRGERKTHTGCRGKKRITAAFAAAVYIMAVLCCGAFISAAVIISTAETESEILQEEYTGDLKNGNTAGDVGNTEEADSSAGLEDAGGANGEAAEKMPDISGKEDVEAAKNTGETEGIESAAHTESSGANDGRTEEESDAAVQTVVGSETGYAAGEQSSSDAAAGDTAGQKDASGAAVSERNTEASDENGAAGDGSAEDTETKGETRTDGGENETAAAGVKLTIKDGDPAQHRVVQTNGSTSQLLVHAWNSLAQEAELNLYFWSVTEELPEEKALWPEVLTVPCSAAVIAEDESRVRLEQTALGEADGTDAGEAYAFLVQEEKDGAVVSRFLTAHVPSGHAVDFTVLVRCDAAEQLAVVPVFSYPEKEKTYFDPMYLTWSTPETEAEGTRTELFSQEEDESMPETEQESEAETEYEHFLEDSGEYDLSVLQMSDFASMRLIVLASEADVIIDPEHLIADYGTIFLLQYGSPEQAMRAYLYYVARAEAVEPDSVMQAASEEQSNALAEAGMQTMPEEQPNALAALDEADMQAPSQDAGQVIALIDTGVSDGANVVQRISLIDDALEGNGHGNRMAAAILSQNPAAKLLSIRAIGDDGRGAVSSVVAAMEYAINQNVHIINLSLYARTDLLNSVLAAEIRKAAEAGILVVGAAGNDGANVSGYMPGSVVEAWIIGACDETGQRRPDSNYGATVDYYVAADSTSEAAAKFCGCVSANGIGGVDAVLGKGLIFAGDGAEEAPEDETEPATGTEDEAFLLAAAPSTFKILDGSPAWAPESLRAGRASTHKRKAVFGSEEKWAYCLEPLKGPPTHDTEFKLSSATKLGSGNNVAKTLYYLYGGPAWGKDVNGVNLKTVMTDAGCTTSNQYYAITHYVAAYFYLDGDASKWNAHPEGPGVLNAAGVRLVRTLANRISSMPSINDAKASLSASSVSASYNAAKNVYVSQSITYRTFSGNTAKIPLPAGVSLVNDSTGKITSSGTATIAGGDSFHFEAAASPAGTQNYKLTCAVARDFSAYRKAFGGDAQDMGVVYFSNAENGLGFSVNWPTHGFIEIEKHDGNTGTTTPSGGYSLDGAVYGIYTSSGALAATVTISNGRGVSGALTPGTYTVKEISAPAHYAIDASSYRAVVAASQTAKVVSSDAPIRAKVSVRKRSSASAEILSLGGYSLSGAEFGVYTDQGCTSRLATLTSNADGITNEFTLPLPAAGGTVSATYYVREEKAPAGHLRNAVPMPFTVTYPNDAGRTITVDISDDPDFPAFDGIVEKLSEKGNAVGGVQFEVRFYDSDRADTGKLVKTWYLQSDSDGIVKLDDAHRVPDRGDSFYIWKERAVIPKGYMTIQEIKAPAQYRIDDTVYTWDTSGTELTVQTVCNELVPCRILLRKFDTDGKTPLSGVTFELKFLKASETPSDRAFPYDFLLKEGETMQATTNRQGEAVFETLDQGEYEITEIQTADGHTLLKEPITVTLPIAMTSDEVSSQKKADLSKAVQNSGYDEKYYFFECTYEVTNSYNFKIPTTGASGRWKYGYIGIALLAACAFLMSGSRRKTRMAVTKADSLNNMES